MTIDIFNLWGVSSKPPASVVLKMETICYFKMFEQFYHTTRCHISGHLRSLPYENLELPFLALSLLAVVHTCVRYLLR